ARDLHQQAVGASHQGHHRALHLVVLRQAHRSRPIQSRGVGNCYGRRMRKIGANSCHNYFRWSGELSLLLVATNLFSSFTLNIGAAPGNFTTGKMPFLRQRSSVLVLMPRWAAAVSRPTSSGDVFTPGSNDPGLTSLPEGSARS